MLDHDAYYHIVEAIADAAAGQYASALALRPVCSRFRSKADVSLGRHVRIERRPAPPSPAESSGESSGAEDRETQPPDANAVADGAMDSPEPGPLVVLTATGEQLPFLYPSSTPPAHKTWPALARALAHARIIDFRASTTHAERGLIHALRPLELDTLRFIGANDAEFALGALRCRRLVGMSASGLPPTHSYWGTFYPRGTLPRVAQRVVLNVVLPIRPAGTVRMPAWQGADPVGDWDVAFVFRPIDIHIPYPPAEGRTVPALGALFNIAITVIDGARRTYTLVGLEEVEWARLGVPDPSKSKETFFREALEEFIVPVLGLEKSMVNIDEIQSRIRFLSHAEYEKSVGSEEYEGDLLPLDGLFEQFSGAPVET